MPTTYPTELKVKTIYRYEKVEFIKLLSEELHIAQSTLYQWRKEYRSIKTPNRTCTPKKLMPSHRVCKSWSTSDVTSASNAVLPIYERPADMGADVQSYRAGLSQKWFDQLAGKTAQQPQEPAPGTGNSCTVIFFPCCPRDARERPSARLRRFWRPGAIPAAWPERVCGTSWALRFRPGWPGELPHSRPMSPRMRPLTPLCPIWTPEKPTRTDKSIPPILPPEHKNTPKNTAFSGGIKPLDDTF